MSGGLGEFDERSGHRFPESGQFGKFGGLSSRKVSAFGSVVGSCFPVLYAVQFPRLVFASHDFPTVVEEGSVAFMEPPEGRSVRGFVGCETRGETDAGRFWDGFALPLCGFFDRCDLKSGWDDIDEMGGIFAQRATLLDVTRPVSDERGADAAFVDPCLVESVRGVARGGESRA